jgi:hypothetical protein
MAGTRPRSTAELWGVGRALGMGGGHRYIQRFGAVTT